jgi:ankyrin repeat protein
MDQTNSQELVEAVRCNNEMTVKRLLKNGADPNARDIHGRTVLYIACISGFERIALRLISKGADVNLQSHCGKHPKSAILAASSRGMIHVVMCLVCKGAIDTQRALTWALIRGHVDIAQFLLKAGTEIDQKILYLPLVMQFNPRLRQYATTYQDTYKKCR